MRIESNCPRCETGMGKHVATTKQPSLATLEKWSFDGIAKATDGCKVDPDGKCPHGHSSWLLVLGYI